MIPQLILLLRVTGLIFEERQQSARITVSSINDYNISNHKHNFQPNYKLFLFFNSPNYVVCMRLCSLLLQLSRINEG